MEAIVISVFFIIFFCIGCVLGFFFHEFWSIRKNYTITRDYHIECKTKSGG